MCGTAVEIVIVVSKFWTVFSVVKYLSSLKEEHVGSETCTHRSTYVYALSVCKPFILIQGSLMDNE